MADLTTTLLNTVLYSQLLFLLHSAAAFQLPATHTQQQLPSTDLNAEEA